METITGSQEAEAPATSQLPLELWIRIAHCMVQDVDDEAAIIHAWLDARRVCKQFRAAVEIVFAEQILPTVDIEFKVDSRDDFVQGYMERWIYTKTGILQGFTMNLNRFDKQRSSEDGAIEENSYALFKARDFKIKTPMHGQEVDAPRGGWGLVEAWKNDMELYLGNVEGEDARFELTPHIVKLRSIVNDTELPGMKINYEKQEVSFDWRLMLSKFLLEERVVTQQLDKELALAREGKQSSEDEDFSFMDLLEYQRMAMTIVSCYEGTMSEPCQICAAEGDVEVFGPMIKIRGEEAARTPRPSRPANPDPTLPPHSDGQQLRCPYIWRLFYDMYTRASTVRHDFPIDVARVHRARRQAREQRIQRWYEQSGRIRGIHKEDWLSQARTMQRLLLARLTRREQFKVVGHELGREERLSWYLKPDTLPFHRVKSDDEVDDPNLLVFLGYKTAGPVLVYGFHYDYDWEDPRACLLM